MTRLVMCSIFLLVFFSIVVAEQKQYTLPVKPYDASRFTVQGDCILDNKTGLMWYRKGFPMLKREITAISEFSIEDFMNRNDKKIKETIENLVNVLKKDRVISQETAISNISDLNELLKNKNLYALILKNKKQTPTERIQELIKAYEDDKSEYNLKRLNKAVLEDFYSADTPRSHRSQLRCNKYVIDSDDCYTWENVFNYIKEQINTKNLCGFKDWRLPNINELNSLVISHDNNLDLLKEIGFTDLAPNYSYWSSTIHRRSDNFAWAMSLSKGEIRYYDTKEIMPFLVVRSATKKIQNILKTGQEFIIQENDDGFYRIGISPQKPRFRDKQNGTIEDTLTGLIWLKDADCFGRTDFYRAKQAVFQLSDGQCGLTDNSKEGQWRLPTRDELLKIITRGEYDSAIYERNIFKNLQSNWYWTSTLLENDSNFAFVVGFWHGYVVTMNKNLPASHILPVFDSSQTK